MNCKNIMYMSVLFLFLPAWIGFLWVELLKIRGSFLRFLNAWVLGFVTMLSVGQLVLIPMVALHASLSSALRVWLIVLTLLSLGSFYLVLGKEDMGISLPEKTETVKNSAKLPSVRENGWVLVLGVLVAVLVFLQAYIPAGYEHRDDDDARFVSEEVSAIEHDTMYWDDPITIDQLYWNEGEVRKDFTSPWAMYVAMCSKISGIAPAALSHSYLPFYLILLCYALYLLIGWEFFHDREKTLLFLLFLSVIHLFGYTSTHTLASMMLLRIWQGKAVCAAFMLPALFYVMYQLMKKEYQKGWLFFLYVASNAACLLSGIGIVTAPVIVFLYGIVDFFYHRKFKKLLIIWMAAAPSALYLLYYMMG